MRILDGNFDKTRQVIGETARTHKVGFPKVETTPTLGFHGIKLKRGQVRKREIENWGWYTRVNQYHPPRHIGPVLNKRKRCGEELEKEEAAELQP